MRADEVTESLVSLYNHFRYSHRKVPKAALKPSRKTLGASFGQTYEKTLYNINFHPHSDAGLFSGQFKKDIRYNSIWWTKAN